MSENYQKSKPSYPKLVHLTCDEQKILRSMGLFVPFKDYDVCKVNFSIFLERWPLTKKLAFAKRVLEEIGISISLVEKEYIVLVDYQNNNANLGLEKLSDIDNSVAVRKPESDSEGVPSSKEVKTLEQLP